MIFFVTDRKGYFLKKNFSKFHIKFAFVNSDFPTFYMKWPYLIFFLSNRCNKKTVLCLPPGPQDGQFIWKRFLWWGILEFKQNLEHWFTRFHTLVWFFYEIVSSHLTQIVSPESGTNHYCVTFLEKLSKNNFFHPVSFLVKIVVNLLSFAKRRIIEPK